MKNLSLCLVIVLLIGGFTNAVIPSHAGNNKLETPVKQAFKPASPLIEPPPTGCDAVPDWNASTTYYGGMEVYYLFARWRAKWYTQGDRPGGTYEVWELREYCVKSN